MSIIAENGAIAKSKLPLWDTIGLSYSTYFRYFGDVLRISWLWLLLLAPLNAATSWYQMSWMAGIVKNPSAIKVTPAPLQITAFGYAVHVILFFAGVSIAVAWHRRLLLNDAPRTSGSNIITGNVWHYIGTGLLIGLIVALPAIALAVPFFFLVSPNLGASAQAVIVSVAIVLLYFLGFAVVLRLCMLLPARAVGDNALTAKQSWKRTSGNTWRIFWGIVICTAPPLFSAEIILLFVIGTPSPDLIASGAIVGQMAVISASFMAYYLLTLPIFVGFLSHAYRHFFLTGANTPYLDQTKSYGGSSMNQPAA